MKTTDAKLTRRLREKIIEYYEKRLVSLVIFGSLARGKAEVIKTPEEASLGTMRILSPQMSMTRPSQLSAARLVHAAPGELDKLGALMIAY